MYIKLSGVRYPCAGTPTLSGDTLRFCLPGGGPEAVEGILALCADDGFVLREIDTEGYTRREMEGDVLVLTNLPRPEPMPEPEPTAADEIARLKAALEATDYQIIKCSEYRLAGMEEPYDIAALHGERQGLRDEINRLEGGA